MSDAAVSFDPAAAHARADATLVLAHDPDGVRHVFLTSTPCRDSGRRSGDGSGAESRGGTRSMRHGIADLSSDAPTGSLARLVAPTRLASDDDFADLLAHLVPLPSPLDDDDAPRPIEVLPLTPGPALAQRVPGPAGRDFELRTVDPSTVFGDGEQTLLFANAHAPGGAWWRPIGAVSAAVRAFGHLAARAGLLGAGARTDEPVPDAIERCDGRAIEALLRGSESKDGDSGANESGAGDSESAHPGGAAPGLVVRNEDAGATWIDRTEEGARWTTPAWSTVDVERIDAARANPLAPYWLLRFESRAGVLRLAAVVNARRHLVHALTDGREVQP